MPAPDLTDVQIIADAIQLETWLMRRDMKYLRNLNRYNNNGQRIEQIYDLYNNPVSYYFQASDDNRIPWPIENVIKSCIDTKVSKMSQLKVRPFFNPVNGLWKTRKVCRVAQQWSDEWCKREKLYPFANMAYRDAQIFDVGHIWVNEVDRKPVRIMPWEYYIDPAEQTFKKHSRCMVKFRQYPLWALRDIFKADSKNKDAYERNPFYRAKEYRIYYHLDAGKRYDIVDGEVEKIIEINFKRSPVATIHYCPPVKGIWTSSLVDDLITLQKELDLVNEKIHDAEENTPANLILVPTIGGVKASTFDAGKAALMWEYEPVPGVAAPANYVTPASVNPQLLQRRKEIIESMYNISGVSMLSAQSKKPTGINSGVMLDTLEDVESERFNFEQQNFEEFCMTINEIAIEVFPEDAGILPKRKQRPSITWKQIKDERDFYSIQFAPASALSNTPKVKMEQVEKLQKMGLIGPEWVAEMLQFPDLEKSYGIAAANRDDIEMITERAAEDGEFDFYEIVNMQDLLKNVMNEIMRLDADEEDVTIIENLIAFMKVLKGKIDAMTAAAQPPVPPPQAPQVMLGQGKEPVPQAQNALADGNGAPMSASEPVAPPEAPESVAPPEPVSQPVINVTSPAINLTVVIEKDGKKRIIRDGTGSIVGSEPIPDEPAPGPIAEGAPI